MAWVSGPDIIFLPGGDAVDPALADVLALAACEMVERWCGRRIERGHYHEWTDRSSPATLLVENTPVSRVYRAASGTAPALELQNRAGAVSASVSIDDGWMSLSIVGGPHAGDENVRLADYGTMAALLAAIVALGREWTGQVLSEDTPTSLRPAFYGDAIRAVRFDKPGRPVQIGVRADRGIVSIERGNWHRTRNYIEYDAGYEPVPDALVHLTRLLALDLYRAGTRDSGLTGEKLGQYSWTAVADGDGLQTKYARFLKHWTVTRI